MTKISLEIDDDLNKQLKQYALDKYGSTHGKQQGIIRGALVAYLKEMSKPALEVESTVEEIPQEPVKAKAQPKGKKEKRDVAVPEQTTPKEGKTLDKHALALINLLAEKPNIKYTTSELMDKLRVNKTTTIQIMKRAVQLDSTHVKMSQGERRKLFLAYEP